MDIIFVTYNSEKWINNCFSALFQADYDLNKVNIYVIDNNSDDNTLTLLKEVRKKSVSFLGSFEIIESNENMGFGKANNIAFEKGKSEIVLFLNIDTETFKDTILKLEEYICNSPDEVVMWELRQFPFEHPKIYNPVNMETSWCSGAAFAVRRDAFAEIGGFDENLFMYVEDVDLSWRIRDLNYKIHYCPKAVITHYSYGEEEEVKPQQYIYSIANNLLLRYRFGNKKDILRWYRLFAYIMYSPSKFRGAKSEVFRLWISAVKIKRYFKNKNSIHMFEPKFIIFDYEERRQGAFYESSHPQGDPLVSVIVRTCGRPQVLRETLFSIKNQTYSNIEIIIAEDGPITSREMITSEFGDLNIKYFATGEKAGRSKVGNLAMQRAQGKYLNFLDDDDLFYADHVEVLVQSLENTDCMAAYAIGCETKIEILNNNPYQYKIHESAEIHMQDFDRMVLCHHNYIPIQCIMFEKTLFENHGGFDESLDALEDWDLWVRYSLYTDFKYVKKTTSLYRVPFDSTQNADRQAKLDEALKVVREKHKTYFPKISVFELAQLYEKLGKY